MLMFAKLIKKLDSIAMKHARIAVFEDSSSIQNLISMTLLESQHEVAATATTREEALHIIEATHVGRLALDAVLLDGNLDHDDFSDARIIYDRLQRLELKPAIIGISTEPLSHHGLPLSPDVDITKWQLTQRLTEVLDWLPEPRASN